MINYELIDRKYIINRISAIDFEEDYECDEYSGNVIHFRTCDYDEILKEIKYAPAITEKEIVKSYLDKLKEQIAESADKQFKIAMGTADLNERYAHIRVESAFRQCIAMIDNLLSEQGE